MRVNRHVRPRAMNDLIALTTCGGTTEGAECKPVARKQWMGTLRLSHIYARKVDIFYVSLSKIIHSFKNLFFENK